MNNCFDIAIVGAGAAGLVSAICSSRLFREKNRKYKIALIEKNKVMGKKILVTGNGKCNISNMDICSKFYYGNSIFEVGQIIKKFNYRDVTKFFNSLGIVLKSDDEKRLYPLSSQASAVLDIMLEEIDYLKIDKFCEFCIMSIRKNSSGMFEVTSEDKTIVCRKLIVCTGGKSSPFPGYDGDGYEYLLNFGHTVSPVFPALVPVKSSSTILKKLKGIRWTCKVSLLGDGDVIGTETGEVQFNENNLSGICVFQLSRLVSEFTTVSRIRGKKYEKISISLDLFPDLSKVELESMLRNRLKKLGYMSIENFMAGILNKKLAIGLLSELKFLKKLKFVKELKSKEVRDMVRVLKDLRFNADGVMDWKNSQVTAGGVRLSEFDVATLESKKEKGLYCAGELLDVDGMCGGYNLHWAWASGYICGISAANSIIEGK